jgi:hypothetical protein
VAVIGLTAEELMHLSMLGFRSFSFPARAFLPVLSVEPGILSICNARIIYYKLVLTAGLLLSGYNMIREFIMSEEYAILLIVQMHIYTLISCTDKMKWQQQS